MIRLEFLGKYGGVPGEDSGCSSFIVENDNGYILFECGSGVHRKLLECKGLSELKAIIISHLHFDHFNDLLTLYYQYKVEMPLKGLDRITVYLPATPENIYDFLFASLKDVFNFAIIDETTELTLLGNVKITFCGTQHDIETYAMRIEDEFECYGYTADTGYFAKLLKFLSGVDLLIAESSLTSDLPKNTNHMTSYEAVELAIRCKAQVVILTHFWYELPLRKYKAEVEVFEGLITIKWNN